MDCSTSQTSEKRKVHHIASKLFFSHWFQTDWICPYHCKWMVVLPLFYLVVNQPLPVHHNFLSIFDRWHRVLQCSLCSKKKKKNFMAPFYGWGSTTSRLEPLRGGSLLFTTKFPEIPGTHFINLRRMKGWVNLGAT